MVFLKIGIPLNMNMTYKTICISSGCNLKVPYRLIGKLSLKKIIILKNIIKQHNHTNTFTTTEHHNLRVLMVQIVT